MRTPSSTRTKDDANKEIHELDLKINKELARLEVLQRDRSEAETGFSLREISSKKIEEQAKRDYEKAIKEKEKTERKLEEITAEIQLRNRTIISQNSTINKNKLEILDLEAKKRNCENVFIMAEKEKKEIDAKLDLEIKEKQQELHIINHNIFVANRKLSLIEQKEKEIKREIREKKEIITKDEIELEHKKSDLRTISVRLNNKYGKFINDAEKKNITI